MTPATKSSVHYYWSISRNFGQENKSYSEQFTSVANKAFEEDVVAVKQMQQLLPMRCHLTVFHFDSWLRFQTTECPEFRTAT